MSPAPVAIVGVGPGIGVATARRFGREGHPIALMARDQRKLDGIVADLEDEDLSVLGVAADAADPAAVASAFERIRSELGDPGVLVMNVVGFGQGKATTLDLGELDVALRASIGGALACVQQVVPAMREAGRGTLLLTGGGLALDPFPNWTTISLGKAGQRALWLSLAKELEPVGIHVGMVTVNGFVKPGTALDPALIADAHRALFAQERSGWERELVLSSKPA